MQCPKCNTENPESAKFCLNCGAKLVTTCSQCGSELPPQARFCFACGTPVSAPPSESTREPGAVGLTEALKRLVPKEFAERLLATRGKVEGERRIVTILFSDVKGSTAMAENLDPEEVMEIMDGAFDVLIEPIYRYEGTLARLMGDAILAFFGAPIAHEDDPERACRAALAIIEGAHRYAAHLEAERGIRGFNVRVGINTGLVVVGEVGSDLRVEYTAMGDAVNLAARMESAAEPGTVLITADTHKSIAPLFETEALRPGRVKGKTEPVSVYRVLATKPAAGKARGIAGLKSPLVGRDFEVAAFTGCVERLLAGQGGIVSVIGEAGLGKSRLVAEIRGQYGTRNTPCVWLEGRTLSFGQTISYWPFQEIIRQYAGITEGDDEGSAWAKLESQVAVLFPEQVAEVLPYLASLLALPVRGEYEAKVKYLDSEAMGRQIFLVSRRFFARLAQAQPLVLVFEDMHWIDQSSAALLEHLLPLVESVPVLFCGVSRPDPHTPAARLRKLAASDYGSRYAEIRLQPLSQAESDKLVRNLLASDTLLPSAQAMILHKAEGNPFFVEEVIHTLIAMGAIVRDSSTGRWQVTAAIAQITIPDTLQGVIMARIDRLDEEVKQVLRVASVIGRSFLYRVLRALAEADRELDHRLDELQQVELIRERSRIPELEYIFKHVLTQEATYASILLQRRRELHTQVGACIETLFAERLEGFYGLLAYHYARAEVWEKAQAYLLKAGDQAGQVAADAEALAHYQQALEAYTRVFGDHWDPLQRAVLERKMGEAFYRRGEHEQARGYLLRALGSLGHSFPTTRWGVRLAIVRELLRQAGHRLLPVIFVKQPRGEADPVVEDTVHLATLLGWIEHVADQERLLLYALWGLNFSERKGTLVGMATAYFGIGYLCDTIGLRRLAGYYHPRALAMAEQIQHPNALAQVYHGLAIHGHRGGEWAAAIGYFERAAAIFQAMGDLHGWEAAVGVPAILWVLRGDPATARNRLLEVTPICRDSGDAWALAWARLSLAHVLVYTGPLTEAVEAAQEAIVLSRTIPDYFCIADASAELGFSYLRMGQLKQALTVLEQTVGLMDEHGINWSWSTQPRNALAAAYLVAAEQGSGAEREAWLRKARRACQAALKWGKVDCAGWLCALRLQARYEWLRGNRRAALREWQRGLAEAQRLESPYEIGMFHLEMGECLGDRAHLEQAEAILSKAGATLDWERTRELLGRVV